MDPQVAFSKVLAELRGSVPPSVEATCLSLNEHGEWELALSHLEANLPMSKSMEATNALVLIERCKAVFKGA
jgi:hypothetical protein